jgi:hypothetical protein
MDAAVLAALAEAAMEEPDIVVLGIERPELAGVEFSLPSEMRADGIPEDAEILGMDARGPLLGGHAPVVVDLHAEAF